MQKDLLLVDFKSTVLTLLVLNRVAMVRIWSGQEFFKVREKLGKFILSQEKLTF